MGEPNRVTLPAQQVEAWWARWNARPRTSAWADRYGGGFERVQELLKNSRQAVEEQRRRARTARARRMLVVVAAMFVVIVLALGSWRVLYVADQTHKEAVDVADTENNAQVSMQFSGVLRSVVRIRAGSQVGTGVVVGQRASSSYILTAAHVIGAERSVRVFLHALYGQGDGIAARVIKASPQTDLAVLSIRRTNVPAIALGRVSEGLLVYVVGFPQSERAFEMTGMHRSTTTTLGVVEINHTTGRLNVEEAYSGQAPFLYGGNSEGLILDRYTLGLVGIIHRAVSRAGNGYSFAPVPINTITQFLLPILRSS